MINEEEKILEHLVEKFKSYKNNSINEKEIVNYLNQVDKFNISSVQKIEIKKGLINLLNNIVFLDKKKLITETSEIITKIDRIYKNGYVVSYGNDCDSNKILLNYINGFTEAISTQDIKNALFLNKSKNLFFLDDAINSGNQIVSIFQEYMGIPIKKRMTNETHVFELSPLEKELLQKANIFICVIYYNISAERFITNELKQLGLKNVHIIYNHSFNERINESNSIFDNDLQKKFTLQFMEKIGISILNDDKRLKTNHYKFNWSKKRIRKSALGYHNSQQLIVYEYNIPTLTPAIFWGSGKIEGIEWNGLFFRRD